MRVGIRLSIESSTVQRAGVLHERLQAGEVVALLLECVRRQLAEPRPDHGPCIQRWAIFALSSSYSHALKSENPSA